MNKEIKVVLDTNIFVNPDARYIFGKTPQEAFLVFLQRLKKSTGVRAYIPPSVFEELGKFIGQKMNTSDIVLLDKKPPSKYELTIPSLLFYEFIEEIRNRVNKGLRIAEKHVRRMLKEGEEADVVKSLREEYRVALREGILDSKEDCDLLLLAKELGAYLATSDNGLIEWASKLGINCISSQELNAFLV